MMCVLITSPARSVLLTHTLVLEHWKLEETDVRLALCGMTMPCFINIC